MKITKYGTVCFAAIFLTIPVTDQNVLYMVLGYVNRRNKDGQSS